MAYKPFTKALPLERTGSFVTTSSLSGDTEDMETPIAAAGAADAHYPPAVYTSAVVAAALPSL